MVTISTTVGDVTLDAALQVCETLSADVTDHPIETGGFVTDHTIERPTVLKVDGIFTETPMDGSDSPGAPTSSIDLLRAAKKTREPCIVTDEVNSYENMVLEALEIPRDGTTGYAIKFSATFKETRFADSQQVAVAHSQKPGTQSNGKQVGAPADSSTQTKAKSGARALTDRLKGRGSMVATPQ